MKRSEFLKLMKYTAICISTSTENEEAFWEKFLTFLEDSGMTMVDIVQNGSQKDAKIGWEDETGN